MKTQLKKWLKENYVEGLSYFWYLNNVPFNLEDALEIYKKDFFENDIIKIENF